MGPEFRLGIHPSHIQNLRGIPDDILSEFVCETKLLGVAFSAVVTHWRSEVLDRSTWDSGTLG